MRAFFFALLSASCGDGGFGGADPDAGADAGDEFVPDPPEAPFPPRLTPCPDGWREVPDPSDTSLHTCDPWPADGPADCSEVGEAHFPGRIDCERFGTACGPDDWAIDLPEGDTIYVKAGAAVGGTGEIASPFANIADALAVATPGLVIAIAKGRYDEAIQIDEAVTLWGACIDETIVASSLGSETSPTIAVRSGGATIGNLTISGERIGLMATGGGDVVTLRAVRVDAVPTLGVSVNVGPDLLLEDVVIVGTRPRPSDGGFGYPLDVEGGASVEVRRAAILGGHGSAIHVDGIGSQLVASDLVVRDTESYLSDGIAGYGLDLLRGAHAEVERSSFVRNRGVSVFVANPGTEITLTDVVIQDGQAPTGGDADGFGVGAQDGARAVLTRVTVDRALSAGMRASGAGSEIAAADFVVRGTRTTGGFGGDGAYAVRGASLALERGVLVASSTAGLRITDADSHLAATDVIVRDTRAQGDGHFGMGLALEGGATADVVRVLLAGNRTEGVRIRDPGTALLGTDLEIRDTLPRDSDQRFGDGLQCHGDARVELSRAAFVGNTRIGVLALGAATVMTLDNLLVEHTLASACVDCPDSGFGTGLGVYSDAVATATRLRISDSALCGLQIADGGTIDLDEGEISRNLIGVNVQTDGFDLGRLQSGMRYVDNVSNLDSQALPVPLPMDDIRP